MARRKAQPKKKPETRSKRVELPHERSPDYRIVYADGSLVRLNRGNLQVVLLADDDRVTHTIGDEKGNEVMLRGEAKISTQRLEQIDLRMPLNDGIQLAMNIIVHVATNAPDALKGVGIDVVLGGRNKK